MGSDHTGEQLVNWLMSKNSVAISTLHAESNSYSTRQATGLPYYLLGRVPRIVIFTPVRRVASARRRRDPFTVDDGTGTVECTFRADQDAQGGRAGENKDSPQEPTKKRYSPLIPVGSVVRVQGRVRAKRNTREIYGESLGPSTTKNRP